MSVGNSDGISKSKLHRMACKNTFAGAAARCLLKIQMRRTIFLFLLPLSYLTVAIPFLFLKFTGRFFFIDTQNASGTYDLFIVRNIIENNWGAVAFAALLIALLVSRYKKATGYPEMYFELYKNDLDISRFFLDVVEKAERCGYIDAQSVFPNSTGKELETDTNKLKSLVNPDTNSEITSEVLTRLFWLAAWITTQRAIYHLPGYKIPSEKSSKKNAFLIVNIMLGLISFGFIVYAAIVKELVFWMIAGMFSLVFLAILISSLVDSKKDVPERVEATNPVENIVKYNGFCILFLAVFCFSINALTSLLVFVFWMNNYVIDSLKTYPLMEELFVRIIESETK